MLDKLKDFTLEGLARHGLAIMISVVLLGWIVFRLDGIVVDTQAKVTAANISMTAFAQQMLEEQKIQTRIYRQTCMNTAGTDIRRLQACVE